MPTVVSRSCAHCTIQFLYPLHYLVLVSAVVSRSCVHYSIPFLCPLYYPVLLSTVLFCSCVHYSFLFFCPPYYPILVSTVLSRSGVNSTLLFLCPLRVVILIFTHSTTEHIPLTLRIRERAPFVLLCSVSCLCFCNSVRFWKASSFIEITFRFYGHNSTFFTCLVHEREYM